MQRGKLLKWVLNEFIEVIERLRMLELRWLRARLEPPMYRLAVREVTAAPPGSIGENGKKIPQQMGNEKMVGKRLFFLFDHNG